MQIVYVLIIYCQLYLLHSKMDKASPPSHLEDLNTQAHLQIKITGFVERPAEPE